MCQIHFICSSKKSICDSFDGRRMKFSANFQLLFQSWLFSTFAAAAAAADAAAAAAVDATYCFGVSDEGGGQ